MKHRWVGRSRDAKKWYEEKRRHAIVYLAAGSAAIIIGFLLMAVGRDTSDPGSRWRPVAAIMALGGTVLAFGPVMYYMADKHTVYLMLPMKGEWEQDLESTWGALIGYLTSMGIHCRRLRSWTRSSVVVGIEQGLRVMMMVTTHETDGVRKADIWLSIHRINQYNFGMAEAVQRILDSWPFLQELKAGVDEALAEEDATMEF